MTQYAEDFDEGDRCPLLIEDADEGMIECPGRLEIKPTENCSCYISPPCASCEEAPLWCPVCGWEVEDLETNNDA